MDDCCAVCAEPLEWVAYGSCGHREVCSTCVVRLRFVLGDKRCCICKVESSTVFVTKAMGDYTRVFNDFSMFPAGNNEGQVGSYWFHEDTQAYFDDLDHYKMIKAMCRLSCSICDARGAEAQGNEASKRKEKFRNIDQLKRHLFHRHKTFMCDLCLEGRKVFICEQKLYSRAQLNQHMSTGDSEVDGSESDRGGFSGHPMCDFCRKRFYGDNELYLHMSTEHYTCHICQRMHPGQYDYYKNYDDLEMHFRREHFLCEDDACLEKKFVVFASESEMKRHNALEHGGRMSRSKRNAVLQIPTSFRYRRSNEHDFRRRRGRGYMSDQQLPVASEASMEMRNLENALVQSSAAQAGPNNIEAEESLVIPFELLATSSDVESQLVSSRYLEALNQRSRNGALEESSFPPLPAVQANNVQNQKMSTRSSMAARLRNKGRVTVLNSAQRRPPMVSSATTPVLSSAPARTSVNPGHASSNFSGSSWESSGGGSSSHLVATTKIARAPANSSVSPVSLQSSISSNQMPQSSGPLLEVEDIQAANRSLVEKIRAGLDFNVEKYASFREISAQYRQGQIDTKSYLTHVQQFGLSHLVLELARLCPDPHKQRELLDVYNASLKNNGMPQEAGQGTKKQSSGYGGRSVKGKAPVINEAGNSSNSQSLLADGFIETVRKLQSSMPQEEGAEVLTKDGYRSSKAKEKIVPVECRIGPSTVNEQSSVPSRQGDSFRADQLRASDTGDKWSCSLCTLLNESMNTRCSACGMAKGASTSNSGDTGTSKGKRKTSKFHRVRLGDGSSAALLDLRQPEHSPRHQAETVSDKGGGKNLPVRGVWRNGGGQRLMATTLKQPSK
ncbi:E3 ubiquitin-protein ligase HEL2 [Nymphaea colorata]|nr:E3 ubiquitin-protein ligase HEL2 [Nymphaea colorata]